MNDKRNTDNEALELERSASGKASLSKKFDPEVPEIPKRRRFPKEYKLKILKELSSCKMKGGTGLILRREGLYSTQISNWKKTMESPKKTSKSISKSTNFKNENARLKRRVATLEATVQKKDYLLEAQKKMAEILDNLSKKNDEPPMK